MGSRNILHIALKSLASTLVRHVACRYLTESPPRCQNHRVSPTPSEVSAVERAMSANAAPNILDVIHAHSPEDGAACQAVLYEAYKNLGDSDALYGCGNGFLLEESGRISHLAQEGKLFKAMGRIDSALGRGIVAGGGGLGNC